MKAKLIKRVIRKAKKTKVKVAKKSSTAYGHALNAHYAPNGARAYAKEGARKASRGAKKVAKRVGAKAGVYAKVGAKKAVTYAKAGAKRAGAGAKRAGQSIYKAFTKKKKPTFKQRAGAHIKRNKGIYGAGAGVGAVGYVAGRRKRKR